MRRCMAASGTSAMLPVSSSEPAITTRTRPSAKTVPVTSVTTPPTFSGSSPAETTTASRPPKAMYAPARKPPTSALSQDSLALVVPVVVAATVISGGLLNGTSTSLVAVASSTAGYPRRERLRLVAGLDALGAVEAELLGGRALLGGDRLDQEAVMVAEVGALEHPADEPVDAGFDDRRALGPLVPRDAGELVDLVPGLAAEQLGELRRLGGHEVHAEHRRLAGHAERAVLDRQADEEARRVDRALRREPDQAPGALAAGRGRDEEHRVV